MGDKWFFFDGQKGDKGLDKDETHALSIKKWAESEGRSNEKKFNPWDAVLVSTLLIWDFLRTVLPF